MTEQDWLASEDPAAMLAFAINPAHSGMAGQPYLSPRKLRLFASACMGVDGGISWGEWLEDGPRPGDISALDGALYWIGVKVGQNHPRLVPYADKALFASALRCIAGNPFRPVTLPRPYVTPESCGHFFRGDGEVPRGRCGCKTPSIGMNSWPAERRERQWACSTYYHVQDKQRGPCPWLTPDVLRLSQVAYEDRAEDGSLNAQILLELSDALEEAGCRAYRTQIRVLINANGGGHIFRVVSRRPNHGDTVLHEAKTLSTAKSWARQHCSVSEWETHRTSHRLEQAGYHTFVSGDGLTPEVQHPMLSHLRAGKHYRGCHVIDLLTGRE